MRFYLPVLIYFATKLLVADAAYYPCAPIGEIVCVNQSEFGVCDRGYVRDTISCPQYYNCTPVPVPAYYTVTCRPITPSEYCSVINATDGNYPPIPADPTCRTYIVCTGNPTTGWTGVVYTCPPSTPYYNPTTRVCQSIPPRGCGGYGGY